MGTMKSKIKNFFKSEHFMSRTFRWVYNHLPFNNKVKHKRSNKLKVKGVMKRCTINFNGKNNCVEIEKGVTLKGCTINICGNHNKVILRQGVYGKFAEFCLQDDYNVIEVGNQTSFAGKIHLACIEGTKISIGENCLFSSEIVFRTGDSHVITDCYGNRINKSKDIAVGNHVWLGHRALVNKGVTIANDVVVGTGAIVTKSLLESNCVYAGVPAKKVKENINWDAER